MMGRPVRLRSCVRPADCWSSGACALCTAVAIGPEYRQDRRDGERQGKPEKPLVGANVAVKGTTLGASTDIDGHFFILRVPPGSSRSCRSPASDIRAITIKGCACPGGPHRGSAGEAGTDGHRGGRCDGHGGAEDGAEGRHLHTADGVARDRSVKRPVSMPRRTSSSYRAERCSPPLLPPCVLPMAPSSRCATRACRMCTSAAAAAVRSSTWWTACR